MTTTQGDLAALLDRPGRRRDTGPLRPGFPVGGTHFVTMLKPEVLAAETAAVSLTEAVRVLADGDVTVLRCAVMPARDYGELGFLLAHYPRLHRVAADGERALSTAARRELDALRQRFDATTVVGAYEVAAHDPELTAASVETRCRQAGIHKLGSGSYASVIELHGRAAVVLNGFVPALAAGYLDSPASVGLIECHSTREIADLRANLLGSLNPNAAAPTSLRGALAAALGGRPGIALSEGRNGVHLSAGHLEGMVQAWRYFTAADGHGLDHTPLGRSLAEAGVPTAAFAADHNIVDESGDLVSPHGATEDLGRDEVVNLLRRWTALRKGNAA
ncbi:hypothetical protein [Kutzneria sp. NPDC052558]|uniref:hypothetical protein n=1 Tax=Kutzneria sp. NPDC052558 TaxID=3364121 RepID=UPI0037C92E6D